MNHRQLLVIVMLVHFVSVSRGAEPSRPIVGAIRWDAWYGETGPVKAGEVSLGPPKYHYRLPWFAQVRGDGSVSINGDSPAIMQREIGYAAEAGLDYWAFVDYWDDPAMSIALNRYRSAADKRGIRYCLIEEGARLDPRGAKAWDRLIEHFKDPAYQTVLDGRPLLFLFAATKKLGFAEWSQLGERCERAGIKRPYLVLMGWHVIEDAKVMRELGFDAVSGYSASGHYTMDQPSYADHIDRLRKTRWQQCRGWKIPCVTLASAGWDTRPRNERPPEWVRRLVGTPTPDPTPFAQQKPLIDAVTATPAQLAAHIREAIEWTQANRDINPAQAIIIYGWNENDEGGWLIPTLSPTGQPDDSRIKALSQVLRP